jgi:protocatechuate 3,4-dioxygenase alpha subunit
VTVTPTATPSQTAGPFVAIGAGWNATGLMVEESDPGAISITGTVRDGRGDAVTDALLEFWQPDRDGFGRSLTDAAGHYRLVTNKPESVNGHAPHVNVSLFARGLMQRLVTRIYFSDEGAANVYDPVLRSTDSLQERGTLMARPDPVAPSNYRFDIRLQGVRETLFFSPWPT